MKRPRGLILAIGIVAAVASRPASAAPGGARRAPDIAQALGFPHERGELLVRFKSAARSSARAAAHGATGAKLLRRARTIPNLEHVRLPAGASLADALGAYRSNPNVLYAEPNYVVEALDTFPDDPLFETQWGLHNTGQFAPSIGLEDADIDAPEAWDITTGDSDVVVAVIDTGVQYWVPDLAPNMYRNEPDCDGDGNDDDGNGFVDDCYGIDTYNDDSDPDDDNTHGTHVAGIIGAVGNNGFGVVGVNWSVSMLACKFLNSRGRGTTAGAIRCLDYVALMKNRGVDVRATNNSWGGGPFSQALRDAIDVHRQLGILFIAAAGNGFSDNDAFPHYPSGYQLPNVVAVAATTSFDAKAAFSNYGLHSVHLGAPGKDVNSVVGANDFTNYDGTSMAAPHVTGVAALLAADDPVRDWKAIKNLVLTGTDPKGSLAGKTITGGRLNAHGSLACSGRILTRRLRPIGSSVPATVGVPIELAVMNVDCADPNGEVDVTVSPTGDVVTLGDDGTGLDLEAGDGIYSGQWTPPGLGTFTAAFPDGDVTILVSADLVLSPAPSEGDRFGWILAQAGEKLAVGAPGDDAGAADAGAVHVFDRASRAPLYSLPHPAPAAGDQFGTLVVGMGDRFLVGAPFGDDEAPDAGAAYLLDASSGALLETFANPDPDEDDRFGLSAIEVGGNIAIAAPYDDTADVDAGAAYLFSGADGGLLQTFLPTPVLAGQPPKDYHFGLAVQAVGSTLLVGAPGTTATLPVVYVYDADPDSPGFGSLEDTILSPNLFFQFFGERLAASADTLLVTDTLAIPFPGGSLGEVSVVDWPSGSLRAKIFDPAPRQGDYPLFGHALSFLGTDVVTSAPFHSVFGLFDGAVFLFSGSSGRLIEMFRPPLGGDDTYFGWSVLAAGGEIFVGAPFETAGEATVGAVHVLRQKAPANTKCYRARPAQGSPDIDEQFVNLEGRWDSGSATKVGKANLLCEAVHVDGTVPDNPAAQLVCHKAKSSSKVYEDLEVINAFGVQTLAPSSQGLYCTPAGEEGGPFPPNLDRYLCFKARQVSGTPRFERQTVELSDEFESKRTIAIRPYVFCTPVNFPGQALLNSDRHLTCYQVKDERGQPRFERREVEVQSEFGGGALKLSKAKLLCLETEILRTVGHR